MVVFSGRWAIALLTAAAMVRALKSMMDDIELRSELMNNVFVLESEARKKQNWGEASG